MADTPLKTGLSAKLEPVFIISAFLFVLLVTYLVRHHVFFWDTVQLGSKHAHFYYENHFSQWLLPASIDSGHPPTFGIYLAFVWSLFGKSLAVSHFAMLPFLFGILYFLWQIGKIIAGERNAVLLVLLGIADPTLAAQGVLISPDIVLACFFLMAVCAILKDQKILKTLTLLGLALISMRGMMTVAALFLFEIALQNKNWKPFFAKLGNIALPYFPAGLFGILFLSWHYFQTGWIGYHPDSPWAPSFVRVGVAGFIKNIAVLGWRMLDFGRIALWIILIFVLFKQRSILFSQHQTSISLFFKLFVACSFVLTPTLLLYQALSAHRYLLPVYLSLSLLAFTLLFKTFQQRKTAIFYTLLIVLGLASGNFWMYPDKIAQGWDASLAHLPYYKVRGEMLTYLSSSSIPLDSIGTAFPEIGPLQFRDLSDRLEGFTEKDFATQQYILYSNVMNDFTDEEVLTLQQHWTPIKTYTRHGIFMTLYFKK